MSSWSWSISWRRRRATKVPGVESQARLWLTFFCGVCVCAEESIGNAQVAPGRLDEYDDDSFDSGECTTDSCGELLSGLQWLCGQCVATWLGCLGSHVVDVVTRRGRRQDEQQRGGYQQSRGDGRAHV